MVKQSKSDDESKGAEKPEDRARRQLAARNAKRALMDKVRAEELAIHAAKQSTTGTSLRLGRPSSYTEEKAAGLLQWIEGGKSIGSWCRRNRVAADSVYRWLRDRPEFRERYAHAHEVKADTLADELVDLVDNARQDLTREQIELLRLRIDVRKWVASKLRPIKWGDRPPPPHTAGTVMINIGIPRKPVVIEAEVTPVDPGASGQAYRSSTDC